MSTKENRRGLDIILDLGIVADSSPELHGQAWDLATQRGLPNAYDAHCLALSQSLCCWFWTADARLGAVSRDLPWTMLLSQDAGGGMGTAPLQDPWYNDRFKREVH